MKAYIIIAALLTTSCTTAGTNTAREEQRTNAFAGVTKVGAPENCITTSSIRTTKVLNDNVIDFEMLGGKTYRNLLPNSCSGLGFEEAFSYETSINKLCNVDIIRVVRNVGGSIDNAAACGLGKFQEITKNEPE